MYKKIMVPLDGSELAECVLPHVETFINDYNIPNVLIVRVVEPEISYRQEDFKNPNILAEREERRRSAARDYLGRVADRLKKPQTMVDREVLVGRVAESLIDYADKHDLDLILIATHGRSGVTRWVRGSVADKVLRSSTVPVLMVRAPGTKGGV